VFRRNYKIGIFWEQFEWGGVESHIKYLLDDWKNTNDKFIIYHNEKNKGAIRLKKEIKKKIVFKKYKTFFNTNKNYFNFILIPLKFFFSLKKYYNFLKKERLDVIICENGGYPAAYGVLVAIVSSFKIKIPVRVLIIHHEAVGAKLYTRIFRNYLDKIVSKSATDIIAVSNATMYSIKRNTNLFYNKFLKKKIIYNAVPRFNKLVNKNIFKKKKNEKLIGILGRIEPYKGHEDLIIAFSKLPTNIKKNYKILIIGNGNKENIDNLKFTIKKLGLKKNIVFKGFLKEKIENIIKSLDLVVMPTRDFEGFGYTMAESMSIGVPVLASKVGAIPEIMTDNEGNFFKPKNINDLSKKLIDFHYNRSKWKKKSIKAKIEIHKKFNSKKIIKEFRSLFI
tara:strand:- start:1616 stop:2794 length:1179 start_codon:yes stop_codon:yes gene_type:complete